MIKINTIETALKAFEEASIRNAECNESGDYKNGNKAQDLITKALDYLRDHNQLLQLKQFFNHPNVGPRRRAATALLPLTEEESMRILTEIAKGEGDNAFSTRMSLKEWAKPDSGLRKYLMRNLQSGS